MAMKLRINNVNGQGIEMRYGIIVDSLAHIYTGMTIKIKDATALSRTSDLYILEDGEYCDAMPKNCVQLINKKQFDFFQPRTDFIKQFIAENDKEVDEKTPAATWNNTENCEYPTCETDEAISVWVVIDDEVVGAWYRNPRLNEFWFESDTGKEIEANLWIATASVTVKPTLPIAEKASQS